MSSRCSPCCKPFDRPLSESSMPCSVRMLSSAVRGPGAATAAGPVSPEDDDTLNVESLPLAPLLTRRTTAESTRPELLTSMGTCPNATQYYRALRLRKG